MDRIIEFLKQAGVYYIATVEGDQPRVRPFGTVNEFEGRLYIQTGKGKPVAAQIAANPKVELCAMAGDKWIRLAGILALDERTEPQEAMLNNYPELRAMYTTGPEGNTLVYYFKEGTATISAFSGETEVIKL